MSTMRIRPFLESHSSPRGSLSERIFLIISVCCLVCLSTQGFILTPQSRTFHTKLHLIRTSLPDTTTTSSAIFPTAATSSTTSSQVDTNQYDLSLFSPCKINLFLRILRKRPDGYHDLASLFQTIGFGDTLHLKLLPPDSSGHDFECNMEGVPTDSTNLVIRALDLIRTKTRNEHVYFKANLVKNVPAQAGLGGGSGNAATAMFGANELLGRPATHEQLVEWSGELGSDITFFLSRGTAYCTGRGEIMTPVDPLPSGTKVCIVKPDIGLSTPAVFKELNYDELSTKDPKELLQRFMDYGIDAGGDDAYVNDLEPPAFRCVPKLKALKEELLTVKGFEHVMMSGSGTSIFCVGEPEKMEEFMETFGKRKGISVFPTQFINRKEGEGIWFEQ